MNYPPPIQEIIDEANKVAHKKFEEQNLDFTTLPNHFLANRRSLADLQMMAARDPTLTDNDESEQAAIANDLKNLPPFEPSPINWDSAIVLNNIPVVKQSSKKFEKLRHKLLQRFSKYGNPIPETFCIPVNDDGESYG